MSWRDGLRKGRSHLLFALVLAAGGLLVVNIEDETLKQETNSKLHPGASSAESSVRPNETPRPVSKAATHPMPLASDVRHIYVQIGAYQSKARAAREGRQALRELGDPAGLSVRIEAFRKFYRLQLGPLTKHDAMPLCQRLVSQRRECQLVRGDRKTSSSPDS
ncbi:hypothetical protein D0Z70_21380 [Sphingobium terrigena]|uniref:SPOR domain-containing protein n=1 Tax=Sphingobium terrigena TaxID=2304063 RepID=A0A418YM25_9SPHN|nr:SPOR domain-containing protein [Sphingobium terrigena]RJG52158.1 hypothetical protein D0Z70_21380 [Sphingobium terrigena]